MITPPQSPAVLALKALWREYPALSTCAPLAGKLAAINAAKAGACPIGANYVAQGYSLPDGMMWHDVAAARATNDVAAIYMPIAIAPGCVAWGVPMLDGRYLLHPGNAGARA